MPNAACSMGYKQGSTCTILAPLKLYKTYHGESFCCKFIDGRRFIRVIKVYVNILVIGILRVSKKSLGIPPTQCWRKMPFLNDLVGRSHTNSWGREDRRTCDCCSNSLFRVRFLGRCNGNALRGRHDGWWWRVVVPNDLPAVGIYPTTMYSSCWSTNNEKWDINKIENENSFRRLGLETTIGGYTLFYYAPLEKITVQWKIWRMNESWINPINPFVGINYCQSWQNIHIFCSWAFDSSPLTNHYQTDSVPEASCTRWLRFILRDFRLQTHYHTF